MTSRRTAVKCPVNVLLASVLGMAGAAAFAAPPAGRWLGVVHVPGQEIRVVVDLDQNSNGHWIGSLTSPDLNLKGAELSKIDGSSSQVAFSLDGPLGSAPDGLAVFTGALHGTDSIEGTFVQGGHSAPLSLHRAGGAQVELPPQSTSVEPGLVGTWRGDYELSGYPHRVTLTFANRPGTSANVGFELVGKMPHTLAVDLVSEEEGLVRVESHEYEIAFEGRLQRDTDELRGTVEQGPLEGPIVLRRAAGGAR